MQHNPNLVLVMYAFFTLYRPHWLFGLAKWEILVHLAVTVIVVLASCLFLFVFTNTMRTSTITYGAFVKIRKDIPSG